MLHGLPPPTGKQEVIDVVEDIFVKKEKMLEPKYLDTLRKIIKLWRDYEHGTLKKISGKEIDELMKEFKEYTKRLKELKEQIEKRANEKTIEQYYNDITNLLRGIFGKKSEQELVKSFEAEMIEKGKMPEFYLRILKDVFEARQKFREGKMPKHEIGEARKNATLLVNHLIEYNQRCELIHMDKNKFKIKAGKKIYDLVLTSQTGFLVDKDNIKKITSDGKIEQSNRKEMNESILKTAKEEITISGKIFEALKKEFKDFEIIL